MALRATLEKRPDLLESAELDAARGSQRLLETLLEHLPDFIAHITHDGRFHFLNRFATGFSAQT